MLEFSQAGGYIATIKEDGTSLTTLAVSATLNDPNITDNITYAFLTDANTGAGDTTHLGFTIDAANGTISFTGTASTDLDFETIAENPIPLTVRATHDNGDANVPNPSDDITVTITVEDVNEFAPVFVTPATDTTLIGDSANVAENAVVNDRVGLFRATDADGDNNVVGYTLAGGGGVFDIREVAGTSNWEIYVTDTSALDFESSTKTYNLVITASDSDPDTPKTETKPVRISITDANDNAPMLGAPVWVGSYATSVREDTAANTALFQVTATDGDTATTPPPTLTYKIVSIDGVALARITNPLFRINPSDGNVAIANALDYETAQNHTLIIRATDGTHPSNEVSVTINVADTNDNAPMVTVAGTGAIDERIAGATDAIVATGITITLADADATDAYKSGVGLTPNFRVLNAGDDTHNTDFAVVDDGSGNWVLQYTGTTLSAESTATITLKIEVSDGVHTPADVSDAFTITINNLQEGAATYIVEGSVAADAELTAMVAPDGADPDGVDGAVPIMYRWFTKSSVDANPTSFTDSGSGDFQWLGAESTDNTYTIMGAPVAGAVYGVLVRYTDGFSASTPNFVPALASALKFSQIGGYSATIKEDGTSLTTLDIDAVLDDSADNITYAFLTDASTDTTATTHQGFAINATDGTITFTGTASTYLISNLSPTIPSP